jgi:hypothetical protein
VHGRDLLLQLSKPPPSDPRRRWTTAILIAAALLVVPFVVWLALPAPPPPPPARSAAPRDDPAPRAAPAPTVAERPTRPVVHVAASAEEHVAGGVEGEVDGPDGKPVAGASVTCTVGDHDLEASSDDAGRFQLPPEADGCKAVARKEGLGLSDEVALRAGPGNRLRLSAPCGIAGNVVDEAGAPVMTFALGIASFEPAGDAGARPAFTAHIDDAEGAFERTDLVPGRYVLAVSVPLGPMTTSASVEVKPGQVTRGVRIVVHPGITVVGTVTDAATGARIEDALAFVLVGGMQLRSPRTPGGEFKIEGAPAEGFDLHVFRLGYTEHVSRGLKPPAGANPFRVDVALTRAPPEEK